MKVNLRAVILAAAAALASEDTAGASLVCTQLHFIAWVLSRATCASKRNLQIELQPSVKFESQLRMLGFQTLPQPQTARRSSKLKACLKQRKVHAETQGAI